MRRARSQLNKLTQQQASNFGGMNNFQNPHAIGNEVDEIQRRLDALQYQQSAGQQFNEYGSNHGFPQPQPSSGFHQPQPSFQQPAVNHYVASNMAMDNPYNAPSNEGAANPQLDTIKSALEQMSSKLHSINNANSASRNQQNEALKQHYNHINTELQGLKASIAGISQSSVSDRSLETIQETLSANYRAIMQQLEGSQNLSIDNSVFSSALEVSHKELSQQIIDVKQSIDATLNNPNHYAKTLEASHSDITKRLDDMHNALQTSIATPDLYVSTIENNHNEVLQQVSQLQQVIDNLEKNTPESSQTDLTNVEMRLEEITRAVVALSLNDGSFNNLERIEARVSDIAKTIDANNTSSPQLDNSGFERLEEKLSDIASLMNANSPDLNNMEAQIGALSEKLENLSSVSTSTPLSGVENNALLMRMDELVEQIGNSQNDVSGNLITQQLEQISGAIDKLSTPSPVTEQDSSGANEVIIQQLEQIAGAIDQLSQPSAENMPAGQFASIENQLSEISNQLNSNPLGLTQSQSEVSLDPIVNRLSGIEEQMGANRDITIELATKAAEDAVKMSVQAMPQMAAGNSQIDTSVLSSMSELLAQLNHQTETNNSTNIEAFGAVTQTLDLMVQRLGKIESGLAGYDNNTAQVMPSYVAEPESAQQKPVQTNETPPSIETEVETFVEPVEEVKKARNPAADLVKAARLSAEPQQVDAPVIFDDKIEEIANEPIIEPILETATVGDVQVAVEEAAQIAEAPSLPDVNTPDLAMEELPDFRDRIEAHSGPDVALEPGTGGPDLAALVRQANDRRKNKGADVEASGTDFIAAARRAAQAAAQEAGDVEEEIEEKTKTGLLASLPELFAKRKKVIIMAAAAVMFVTLAGTLASQFFGGNDAEIAAVDNTVVIEETVSQEIQPVAAIPSQDTVSPVEVVEDSAAAVAVVSDVQPLETTNLEPQEVNLASVNLNENPAPASFIKTDELNFASTELKQAVQKSEPAALFEIGRRYTNGIGTEKDLVKASQWYERAANMGFAPAQYIIGNFNEKGLGIEKNPSVAAEWYKQAAKGGNIIAMHNLAVLTATPNALSANPDMSEAFKWFSNAADYGVRDSQVNAGIFHTKGFGTEVNLIEAYKWFAIAAKAGDKDAGSKRDVIANAIQPDQLEIAKALVKDWVPLEAVQAANEVAVNEAWKSPQAVASAGSLKIDRNTIAQTQALLSKVGFNAGVADGLMGQKTRNAIAAFQQKSGLPVNGRIDDKFLQALRAVAI